MSFPQHTPHFTIHPCLPLSNRLETCWATSHFHEECAILREDLIQCYTQEKNRHYNNLVSLHGRNADVRVPIFDIVNDRFEGMESDQTLRSTPPEAINSQAKV
jgi:hypothetical protein